MNKELNPDTNLSHYRIVAKIGAGGMGEVYLAHDTILDRKVALKILPPEFAEDKGRMSRFVREAKSASALNHPNIITIHEIGESDGTHFIATEFIDGETLHKHLKGKNFSLKSALDIATQIASALQTAHSAGIIHRDIKPENIMLRDDGFVKVLDFGLAKLSEPPASAGGSSEDVTAINDGTSPGMIIGTAHYMSPEQAKGKEIDARSDIFGFGIVFYEMLTGKRAFEGESGIESLSSILKDEPQPISQILPGFPGEIERIVNKALRKNREERYQTAKDLLIDLKDAKQKLELQNLIDRSIIPDQDQNKTQILQTTTLDGINRITTNQTISSRPKTKVLAIGLLSLVVVAGGFFGYKYFSQTKQIESIAVMPFVNDSGNPDGEYLSDGMTETLINSLSQIPNLSVKARSSVFRYKGKEIDPKKIASELHVQAVLTGRVVQRGDLLTLSVELIDAQTENAIWGNKYERKASDLVSLQSEIAHDVSSKLKSRLSSADTAKVEKNYTTNAEAYQLYLKGRFYWNKRTDEGFKQATIFFQEAIDKDPNYALAYTGLADCYTLRSDYGFLAPKEGYALAKGAVTLALKYDEGLAEAHTSLASIKAVTDWDWQGAENEYRRAIELNPNYPTAHHWYAAQLMLQGRLDQALQEIKKAQQLDPLSLAINKDFAVILLYARDYDKALEQCRKTLEIEPDFGMMSTYIAQIYELRQKYPEAIAELEKAHAGDPEDIEITYSLGQAYALSGKKDEALKILNELNQPATQDMSLPKEAAYLYALLGEKEQAVAILQKAAENHYISVAEVKMDPRLAELRKDARVVELLQQIGLSQ
jgi:serine/threonine-protein kinase